MPRPLSATTIEHAVFETSRHAGSGAKVQIVGAFETLGIVVPAAGSSEPMAQAQGVEALRNALGAMGEASERLEERLGKIDPDGSAPKKPGEPVPPKDRFA